MATQQEALRQARMNDARVRASLQNIFANIDANIHDALREVGEIAVQHSRETHEYGNRSGALERSHGFVVAGSGQTVSAEYDTPNGRESFPVTSENGEITMFLYAGMFYAPFVELKNGFSVLINTFLMLRREGASLLAERMRAKRVVGVRN